MYGNSTAPKKSLRPKSRPSGPKKSLRPKSRPEVAEGSTRHPSGKNINEQSTIVFKRSPKKTNKNAR